MYLSLFVFVWPYIGYILEASKPIKSKKYANYFVLDKITKMV